MILQNLFIKQFSERTILISRLGIIHTSFNDLRFLYENKINTLQAIIIDFEQEAQQDLKIKKEIFDENIMALKRELIQLKQELVQSREELSRKVIDIAIKLINEHNPYWINQLNYQWDSLYQTYF